MLHCKQLEVGELKRLHQKVHQDSKGYTTNDKTKKVRERCAVKSLQQMLCTMLNALLCLKNAFRGDLQMKVFFSKLGFFDTLFFSKTNEVLPQDIVDFVETSCFIDCL